MTCLRAMLIFKMIFQFKITLKFFLTQVLSAHKWFIFRFKLTKHDSNLKEKSYRILLYLKQAYFGAWSNDFSDDD